MKEREEEREEEREREEESESESEREREREQNQSCEPNKSRHESRGWNGPLATAKQHDCSTIVLLKC